MNWKEKTLINTFYDPWEYHIVDDFLPDPYAAREEALAQEYVQQGSYGVRSKKRFDKSFLKEANIGVSIAPGATAFTLILFFVKSIFS